MKKAQQIFKNYKAQKSQQNFKNYNDQRIEFINISFRLIIFMISLVFLIETVF